jgi:hypothetical protein
MVHVCILYFPVKRFCKMNFSIHFIYLSGYMGSPPVLWRFVLFLFLVFCVVIFILFVFVLCLMSKVVCVSCVYLSRNTKTPVVSYFFKCSLDLSPPVLSPISPIAKILFCPDFPPLKIPRYTAKLRYRHPPQVFRHKSRLKVQM